MRRAGGTSYRTAKTAAQQLSGTPQANIRGVLANLTSLAKRHLLGSRGYPAFLILQRNVEWFYDDRRARRRTGRGRRSRAPS